MKLSPGIKNFWFIIGNFLFSLVISILALLWYGNWDKHILLSLPFLVGFIVGFFLNLLPFIWFLSNLKSQLLQAMPDEWELNVAVLTDYPLLNFTWLREQTNILESLGFVQLMDYQVKPGNGFARCFTHPQHYCFVEIGQLFLADGEIITSHTIFSALEQDWAVGAINRPVQNADGIGYTWRNPKHIRTYQPHLNLDELLQSHLNFRQRIITDLGIYVSTDVSWHFYRNMMQQFTVSSKQIFRRKNLILAMLEATLFELNPKSEWLGDYPQAAAKRGVRV